MRAFLWVILGGLCFFAMGCSSGNANPAAMLPARLALDQSARTARAQSALAILGQPGRRPVTVSVLENNAVGAFSWPSGRLYVTRALVDLADDNELAAALSHEMGHLLNDNQLSGVASLRGCTSGPAAELRADATGVSLLRQHGIPAHAMATLLQKVQHSPTVDPVCKSALQSRIDLLLTQ